MSPRSLAFALCLPVLAAPAGEVLKMEGMKDVFRHGDVFIAGQPNLEALRAFKALGVTLVVNLREEKETREFAVLAFQEDALVKELGMSYLSLPLGEKGTYVPAAVDRLAEAMKVHPGKVLIHCTVGGRATVLYMAHLVRHKGLSLEEATALGRQMKFTFPLEDLLGVRLTLTRPGADPAMPSASSPRAH